VARIATALTCAGALALALSLAAPAAEARALTPPAQALDFGTPSPNVVPMVLGEHVSYAKPDVLQRGRALLALARGAELFVPLRSMFEAMGASVAYDPATRQIEVSKGVDILQLTVGKPQVLIDGESRPLDVGPQLVGGVVVVPIRVIAEGLDADVQWLSDRRVVAVRWSNVVR